MGLPYGENFIILTSTIFDWSTRVSDGRTDRRTGDSIRSALSIYAICCPALKNETRPQFMLSTFLNVEISQCSVATHSRWDGNFYCCIIPQEPSGERILWIGSHLSMSWWNIKFYYWLKTARYVCLPPPTDEMASCHGFFFFFFSVWLSVHPSAELLRKVIVMQWGLYSTRFWRWSESRWTEFLNHYLFPIVIIWLSILGCNNGEQKRSDLHWDKIYYLTSSNFAKLRTDQNTRKCGSFSVDLYRL